MESDYTDGITKAPIVIDNVRTLNLLANSFLGLWCYQGWLWW